MKEIGVSNLIDVRTQGISNKGVDFNIMIAGSHGIGKTTFLKRLLGIDCLLYEAFKEKRQNPYWYLESVCNVQISNFEIVDSNFTIRMITAEIDGVGDHTNNQNCYEAAVELLEKYFIEFEKKSEENVKNLVKDKRFHVCFYMLEPLEDLKIADVEVMKAIEKYCSVIPIIGKADLINIQKMNKIKASLRNQLNEHGINVFDDSINGFEAPFLITSGEKKDNEEGREYAWGNFDTTKCSFNEFKKLKKFVFEYSIIGLKEETEILYNNFRTSKLSDHILGEGKSSNYKRFFEKFDEFKKEIREMKERIKNKKTKI